jgi:2-polyprenyl-3-methyl-5-hydroxy-6-metoxy-1,4-benzoquinol methylase
VSNGVRRYFNGAVDDFDSIYSGKGEISQWMNRRFRRDMYERFRLTFETCGDITGKTVLDIGCGGGRYSVEFARRGTNRVVGIDFAINMVRLAHQHAQAHSLVERCHFMVGDFMETEFRHPFDICVAIGVFDYIAQPRLFLEKMRSAARSWLIMSFPSTSVVRTPLRKIRYWFKKCPVYFYDRESIEHLVNGLGLCRLTKIPGQGMDYFVAIRLEKESK